MQRKQNNWISTAGYKKDLSSGANKNNFKRFITAWAWVDEQRQHHVKSKLRKPTASPIARGAWVIPTPLVCGRFAILGKGVAAHPRCIPRARCRCAPIRTYRRSIAPYVPSFHCGVREQSLCLSEFNEDSFSAVSGHPHQNVASIPCTSLAQALSAQKVAQSYQLAPKGPFGSVEKPLR